MKSEFQRSYHSWKNMMPHNPTQTHYSRFIKRGELAFDTDFEKARKLLDSKKDYLKSRYWEE